MPALSTFVTSITQDKFLPKVVENALAGNVLTMKLMSNMPTWNGGTSIEVPTILESYNQLGSYSGADVLSTTQQNVRQRASFTPSQVYASATLTGIQRAVNQGEAAVIDLVAQEMEQVSNFLKDEMGRQIYTDGTGNSSKDILGLLAAVDDATDVVTYGGISRNTFTNWRATRTAQSGSLSLANLAADFDAAQVGSDTPDLIVTTPAVWTIYEALLTPTVQHSVSPTEFRLTAEGSKPISNLGGNQGFRALAFRGVPVVADEKCTSGNIFTLNTNFLKLYKLPQPDRKEIANGFAWTGWKEPTNQDAVTGQLLWYGQLLCTSPRRQARRTGVTS